MSTASVSRLKCKIRVIFIGVYPSTTTGLEWFDFTCINVNVLPRTGLIDQMASEEDPSLLRLIRFSLFSVTSRGQRKCKMLMQRCHICIIILAKGYPENCILSETDSVLLFRIHELIKWPLEQH